MMQEVKFTDDKANWAKGRSGIFQPVGIVLYGGTLDDGRLALDFDTKRGGSPILVNLNVRDMEAMGKAILTACKKVRKEAREAKHENAKSA